MTTLNEAMVQEGRMSFILGGQWGSEGKGAAAAWMARHAAEYGQFWDVVTTNAGAQAGHTSIHNGKKVVTNHLPTAAIIGLEYGHKPTVYLNAGCIIDPARLEEELNEHPGLNVIIHPNAAVIDDKAREAEMVFDSTVTKIGSTRKGVGQALARKILRFPDQIAGRNPILKGNTALIDLNHYLSSRRSVLNEIPQGIHLGVNTQFYPHTTSRQCTLGQALCDADVHPSFAGETMLVLRPYPIRVGNIVEDGVEVGNSGSFFNDQKETTWEALGLTPEITTVTKRIRRVFTFSEQQVQQSFSLTRPRLVYMAFCDYLGPSGAERWYQQLRRIAYNAGIDDFIPIFGVGPSTDDVTLSLVHWENALRSRK